MQKAAENGWPIGMAGEIKNSLIAVSEDPKTNRQPWGRLIMRFVQPGLLMYGIIIGVLLMAFACLPFFMDDSLAQIQKRGVIRIGYAIEAPYAFLAADGTVTGESPELAKIMARQLNIPKIEWRQMEFNKLIPEIENDEIDLIASGMFITAERSQKVDFSEPTFHVNQGLLVQKGNPAKLHSYQQAHTQRDIKLAVLAGATEADLLRRMGIAEEQIIVVPDALTGHIAVKSGVVHGLALSSPTIRWIAMNDPHGETEIAQPFENPPAAMDKEEGYGAFAFRKGAGQLRRLWNQELGKYMGSTEHRKLIKAFGFTEAELPGNITLKEVLAL